MEGLLGHVIHYLSVSSVYEDGCIDPHVPAVSLTLKTFSNVPTSCHAYINANIFIHVSLMFASSTVHCDWLMNNKWPRQISFVTKRSSIRHMSSKAFHIFLVEL